MTFLLFKLILRLLSKRIFSPKTRLSLSPESELSEAAGTKELLTRRIQQTEDDRIKLEEKELPGLVLEMVIGNGGF